MPHGGRMKSRWTPASVRALRHYSWTAFRHDLLAGVTVGLVALPLAMAFAIRLDTLAPIVILRLRAFEDLAERLRVGAHSVSVRRAGTARGRHEPRSSSRAPRQW